MLVEGSKQHNGGRTELEKLIREFQTKLGSNWDKYHESLSLYLVGKLSRPELVETIRPILNGELRKYHNKLLLLNFLNSLKDGPLDFHNEFASFWNKKAKTRNLKSSQYEKFKQNIMALPIRERRRIKSITKDSGKKGKLNASITLSRHALLPKIPMIQNKEQQQLQVNNLVQWQQDVVNGTNTPIATETYEIPDYDNLSRRVIMTMRENGLTGGLNPQVLEVILLGLETHLKNIIESSIDVARYREKKYTTNDILATSLGAEANPSNGDNSPKKRKADSLIENDEEKKVVLNIEDMYNTFEIFPYLVEPCGPKMRLSNVMLEDDDLITREPIYELPPKPALMENPANGALKIESSLVSNGTMKTPNGTSSEIEPKGESAPPADGKSNAKNGFDESNDPLKKSTDTNNTDQRQPPKTRPNESFVGTTDELKWVLHDLISTM